MIRIAEFLPPQPSVLWDLARQAGVESAVAGLPLPADCAPGESPWDLAPLTRMRDRYASAGFRVEVIEARPPLNLAKRGLPGGELEVESVCTLIENMGRLGIPVWCYEWMADFNWLRTRVDAPSRGGSFVTEYDHVSMEARGISENGPLSEDVLWATLARFLERVLPVAEKAGVRLAMHPDDPPRSPIRGVGRIMRSVENFRQLLAFSSSPMHGICLCQGNFTLMTDDLPGVIREFGGTGRIFFVHFRDVEGTIDRFQEAWHDAGRTNMLECMRAYRAVEFDGALRPDHVPTVAGDSNADAGYSAYGRLYALGYIRGLHEAVAG